MTEMIERGLRTSPPRRPHESDDFALTKTASCIDRTVTIPIPAREDIRHQQIDYLYRAFAHVTPDNYPRTARLLASGTRRTAQKVIEEAGEVALEAVKHSTGGVIRESADLLYHLVALWHHAGIDPGDIWTEMHRRAELLGIAEKLPKTRNRNAKRDRAAQALSAQHADNAE